MENNENKYLKLARRAREENNTEDAKKYYDMVRTENPDNTEARFFYSYYRLWDGTKGEAYGKFIDFLNVVIPVVKSVAGSDASDEEKEKLVEDMYSSVQGLTMSVRSIQIDLFNAGKDQIYNKQKNSCEKNGTEMLYKFGDALETNFAGNTKILAVAVNAWKKAVSQQQQFPYCGLDKTLPEKYLPKIQKVDPSFTLPKKAGCISFK